MLSEFLQKRTEQVLDSWRCRWDVRLQFRISLALDCSKGQSISGEIISLLHLVSSANIAV